jgi:probable rRNA maturation factor
MSFTLIIRSRTRPLLPYEEIKNTILGKSYTLTLVFIGKDRARSLNKTHRNATYVPNVLSFPLDQKTGEIYITPTVAKHECKKFNLSPKGYIGYLFIHGLLHLKGYPHGDTMDRAEKKYVAQYKLT